MYISVGCMCCGLKRGGLRFGIDESFNVIMLSLAMCK